MDTPKKKHRKHESEDYFDQKMAHSANTGFHGKEQPINKLIDLKAI